MRIYFVFIVCLLLSGISFALDKSIPSPVTYEWTIKEVQRQIPRVDLKNTSVLEVIEFLDDSTNFSIRLQHDLPEAMLQKRVDWQFGQVSWIDLVARIADLADAEIIIGKQVVTLKPRESEDGE